MAFALAKLRQLHVPALLGLLLLAVAADALAARIYRYQDESGRTVFNNRIPPEYVAAGYTVLDERGRVLEVVPPAPSGVQVAEQEAARERERQDSETRARQAEADALLLRLYRHPDDVARRRDARLDQLGAQATALEAMLRKVEQELTELEARASRSREGGGQPPDSMLASIEGADAERQRLRARLEGLRGDMDSVRAEAERDMSRLRTLLGDRAR